MTLKQKLLHVLIHNCLQNLWYVQISFTLLSIPHFYNALIVNVLKICNETLSNYTFCYVLTAVSFSVAEEEFHTDC